MNAFQLVSLDCLPPCQLLTWKVLAGPLAITAVSRPSPIITSYSAGGYWIVFPAGRSTLVDTSLDACAVQRYPGRESWSAGWRAQLPGKLFEVALLCPAGPSLSNVQTQIRITLS